MTEKFTEPDIYSEPEWPDVCEDDGCGTAKNVFIKKLFQNGKCLWGIYDAEGERLAVTDNRDVAFVVARQNDFVPCSLH